MRSWRSEAERVVVPGGRSSVDIKWDNDSISVITI
jgi:hypothetical protein